jgi:hypothetical protein
MCSERDKTRENPEASCTKAQFSVHASDAEPTIYKIAGELCGKARGAKTILITSHGLPTIICTGLGREPDTYSFVQNMPTTVDVLNVDLLASAKAITALGRNRQRCASARDPPAGPDDAGSWLHARQFLLGTRTGSGQVVREASKYHDVDGIYRHRLSSRVSLTRALSPRFSTQRVQIRCSPAWNWILGTWTSRPGKKPILAFLQSCGCRPRGARFR